MLNCNLKKALEEKRLDLAGKSKNNLDTPEKHPVLNEFPCFKAVAGNSEILGTDNFRDLLVY